MFTKPIKANLNYRPETAFVSPPPFFAFFGSRLQIKTNALCCFIGSVPKKENIETWPRLRNAEEARKAPRKCVRSIRNNWKRRRRGPKKGLLFKAGEQGRYEFITFGKVFLKVYRVQICKIESPKWSLNEGVLLLFPLSLYKDLGTMKQK